MIMLAARQALHWLALRGGTSLLVPHVSALTQLCPLNMLNTRLSSLHTVGHVLQQAALRSRTRIDQDHMFTERARFLCWATQFGTT